MCLNINGNPNMHNQRAFQFNYIDLHEKLIKRGYQDEGTNGKLNQTCNTDLNEILKENPAKHSDEILLFLTYSRLKNGNSTHEQRI